MKPLEKAEFSARIAGDYLHFIAQNIMEKYGEDYGNTPWEEVEKDIAGAVDKFIKENYPVAVYDDVKFTAQHENMAENATQLLKYIHTEQQESLFHPIAFEEKIGMGGKVPPLRVKSDNGKNVNVIGVRDRIDIYRGNEKDYLRIIDYKTGNQKFDLDEIYNGLSSQLLLYMNALLQADFGKKEKELDKLNRKIEGEGLFLNRIPANVKDLKVESVLKAKELYELYKKYDEAYFNEKVLSVLTSNMTISDVLNLYYSFDYFQKLAIQNVYKLTSYEEVVELSNKFDLFAMDPNNVIIAGLPLFHESNVAKIICNKYHLSSIYLEEDDLTIDNLKPLLNKVYIILRTHMIEKSEISLNQIWFITKVHKFMIEKESKEN